MKGPTEIGNTACVKIPVLTMYGTGLVGCLIIVQGHKVIFFFIFWRGERGATFTEVWNLYNSTVSWTEWQNKKLDG